MKKIGGHTKGSFLFCSLFLLMGSSLSAQVHENSVVKVHTVSAADPDENDANKGKEIIYWDERIPDLMKRWVTLNEKKPGAEGYRVQIFFGSGTDALKNAQEEKAKFMSLYPNMPVNIVFHKPNFKTRVGNCRTRLEAYKILDEVIHDFPGSYVVKDWIDLPRL